MCPGLADSLGRFRLLLDELMALGTAAYGIFCPLGTKETFTISADDFYCHIEALFLPFHLEDLPLITNLPSLLFFSSLLFPSCLLLLSLSLSLPPFPTSFSVFSLWSSTTRFQCFFLLFISSLSFLSQFSLCRSQLLGFKAFSFSSSLSMVFVNFRRFQCLWLQSSLSLLSLFSLSFLSVAVNSLASKPSLSLLLTLLSLSLSLSLSSTFFFLSQSTTKFHAFFSFCLALLRHVLYSATQVQILDETTFILSCVYEFEKGMNPFDLPQQPLNNSADSIL